MMVDRGSRDDFERIRARQGGLIRPADDLSGGGVPAFVGRVMTAGSLIGVDKFLMVQPTSVLGPEAEGKGGQFTPSATSNVAVFLVGPALPATGDYLVCKYVDNRWVADRSHSGSGGGGPTGTIPSCFCNPIPASLSMTSADPNCNYGMFQSCSIQYGPTPAGYSALNLGTNSFLSGGSFPDKIGDGAMFQYFLTCQYNQFNLSRVYLSSPYGSPYRDGVLYSWSVGGAGNTCKPFSLSTGTSFPGSDPSCSVTIQG